jgi:hypothetical protein
VAAGESYQSLAATSPGSVTEASLLGGVAGGQRSVTLDFQPAVGFAVSGGGVIVGDVLSLTGTATDTFVLELSYDDAGLTAADEAALVLQWRDPVDGLFKNAVLGNIGSGGRQFADTPYDTYLPQVGYSFTLGDWGNDPTSNTVWAVVNHNSLFAVAAVVPEPATMTLLALAGPALLRRRR